MKEAASYILYGFTGSHRMPRLAITDTRGTSNHDRPALRFSYSLFPLPSPCLGCIARFVVDSGAPGAQNGGLPPDAERPHSRMLCGQ